MELSSHDYTIFPPILQAFLGGFNELVTFFLQFHETFPEKKGSPPNAEVTIQLIFKFGFISGLKIEIVGADVLDGPISTR